MTVRRKLGQAAAAAAAVGAFILSPASAGAAPAAAPGGLRSVPTTRIMAIGRITPKWTADAVTTVMPQEVSATVDLYLSGKIEQWYSRKDRPGVVFIFNGSDADEVRRTLENLPLGQSGLMDFELIPLGPLAPLGLLLPPKTH